MRICILIIIIKAINFLIMIRNNKVCQHVEKLEEHNVIKKVSKYCKVCKVECKKKCACKLVYYCCVVHQKQDWKNHKNVCKYVKQVDYSNTDSEKSEEDDV